MTGRRWLALTALALTAATAAAAAPFATFDADGPPSCDLGREHRTAVVPPRCSEAADDAASHKRERHFAGSDASGEG